MGSPAISKIVAFLSLDIRRALSRSAGAAICCVLASSSFSVSVRNSRRDSSSATLFSLGTLANRWSAAGQCRSELKSAHANSSSHTHQVDRFMCFD